jgi:PhnB protein
MPVNVYLIFNGNCREAVEFYAQVFETEPPKIMLFGDAPPDPKYDLPEDARNLVMHAELTISGTRMMFSDTFPGMPFTAGNNISLTVVDKDMDKIKTWFNKLKEGGTVDMELQQTFWSKLYGSLTDKFGIPWQLSHNET